VLKLNNGVSDEAAAKTLSSYVVVGLDTGFVWSCQGGPRIPSRPVCAEERAFGRVAADRRDQE
jgi:hypothetical protein